MSKHAQPPAKDRDAELPKKSTSNLAQAVPPSHSVSASAINDDSRADLLGSVLVFALVQYM
jgi:hypothetical protein